MTDQPVLFELGDESPRFEELAHANGGTYWAENDLQEGFGYSDATGFRKVIMRAMQACLSLGILPDDNFVRDGDQYKLTRFACYLVAMNGDPAKSQVAAAQVYFASLAATYQTHLEHSDGIERLIVREEVKTGEKSLASTAARHGVQPGAGYGMFKDAGYRGMYNMSLSQLKKFKDIPTRATIADHMGREELAAHLFRITQTEARINNNNVQGQKALESAAHTVGRSVRRMMHENTGQTPEALPPAEPINKVRTKIKGANKKLKKLDE